MDLPSGTHSIGYFWQDRFYNLYHWITPRGITVALYYYNIADQTRITSQQIEWRDLFVDVLITPDGRCRVLDEDEIPTDMEVSLRRRIEITRDELISGYREILAQFEVISRRFLDIMHSNSARSRC